jgi:phospho-N-acetylmuramoyl-pentapeptide-transferase
MLIANIIKVVLPVIISFTAGVALTPILTKYLYKYKVWKKNPGKETLDGKEAEEFNRMHAKREREVPRMGGIVIWGSVLVTIFSISLLAWVFPTTATIKLDFLSRSQTWIPLFTLIAGALVGLLNDFWDVYGHGKGISLKRRLLFVSAVALFIGWWFYTKLDITALSVPFNGELEIGWLIIPLFMLVSLALYASGVIDGIDGLSGGVFAMIFASYTGIALYQNQIDLAAFTATIMGGLMAFVWFNIPPARFFMTETGTMALTLTLGVVAFMTDSLGGGVGITALPIIGALLVATVGSNVLQVFWKKVFGKKLFRIAPLHHHFEAIGWPSYKVTMRYWILSGMFAFVGFIFALIG